MSATLNSYRPDIDGLRAVAVIAVILFHLRVPGFTGGYVGVDVFFVISGYLITGLVLGDLEKGAFSIRMFYLRRVRRLAPALVTMLLPTTAAAFFVLFPEDMRSFGTSLSLQFVSLQNFFFLADGEYFRGSDSKLLLHTWTLAVEEQFYLVWPWLLLFTRRRSLHVQVVILGGLMAASFGLSFVLMSLSPKAAFFLLPARAWELGLGGLISLLERRCVIKDWGGTTSRTICAVFGLLAVLAAVYVFSVETAFPGYAALLPVLGAAFLVVSAIGGTNPLSRAFSHRFVVRVGLISYPLYLWHWPLIALSRHLGLKPADPLTAVGIVTLTFALSELTFRLAESPVRDRRSLATPRQLITAAGTGALVLTMIGIHLRVSDGASYRYPMASRVWVTAPFASRSDRCGLPFRIVHPRTQVCALHDDPEASRRVLLWGNSHADMWSAMFTELGQKSHASIYLNARNCRIIPDVEFCGMAVQRQVLDFAAGRGITDVVLASTWFGSYGRSDEALEKELAEATARLASLKFHVWLVIDPPQQAALDPLAAYKKNPASPEPGSMPAGEYEAQRRKQYALFGAVAAANTTATISIIDPSRVFCDDQLCRGGNGETPWYRDSDHLSDQGARLAMKSFEPIFTQ